MMRAHQSGGAMSRLEAGDGSEVASLCLGEEAAAAPTRRRADRVREPRRKPEGAPDAPSEPPTGGASTAEWLRRRIREQDWLDGE